MTAHERPLRRGIEIGNRRFVPFPANLEIIIQMRRTIPAGPAMGRTFPAKSMDSSPRSGAIRV
ncbi:hypothetical protein RX330_10655 [Bradyrhizobium sp. NDS-1]|uniref:hypothetical protein n=1 Tax=Bradyrhizobium TaxID=374 RepID=UPI00137471CA|nr:MULTISPECIES: hypothetical protein [Bradyrhizobium]WOH75525.1 hypothetical protein RX330_10655 [Bradyrhizobium sp. NDS-1]